MGQVIRFPALPYVYPTQRSGLDDAEAVLLIGLRWWVHDVRHRQDPVPRLCHGMEIVGAPEAAHAVDALMSITARTARHAVEMHGPLCDCLSLDESRMLQAASLAQAGDTAHAEDVLRTALLTAQGAEMAVVPLQGIGRQFSAARLLLRRRTAPAEAASTPGPALH